MFRYLFLPALCSPNNYKHASLKLYKFHYLLAFPWELWKQSIPWTIIFIKSISSYFYYPYPMKKDICVFMNMISVVHKFYFISFHSSVTHCRFVVFPVSFVYHINLKQCGKRRKLFSFPSLCHKCITINIWRPFAVSFFLKICELWCLLCRL